ncbi:S-adenosylmethionine synthetase N-terminal domain-containing protein [Breoghania sp.]|uniref:S-adenosylmethionine synthetase N-terminal domain-containing protein n=1 Tax=Breoghania sp. TaxID=2065378 RepID=UPI00261CE331|nr:S-adenosylmethionine synthetase N-terminal domain-containing protein [Breoghania sp.]MDJ0932960.1 S-adenosylmethionine synthetase N-terminal domain-containing protein [Breoghania sp.]
MRNFVHTSESVTVGHPDKLCDLISDSMVDAFLTQDPPRSVNAECALASGIVSWRCAVAAKCRPILRASSAGRSGRRAIRAKASTLKTAR